MKIGIFGGAFNPIHNGHLALAKHYKDSLGLDKIIFVPTCIPPHKTDENLISGKDRINMLNLAFDNEKYIVDDLEFHRKGKSYTYYTLQELREKYPCDEFYLIVGSDQFLYFQEWFNADEILSSVTVVTAARENDEYEKLLDFKSKNGNMKNTIVSNFDVLEISSSEIRERIKSKQDVSDFVPKKVLDYIKEHKLYV